MTEELSEADQERADAVREKRKERSDPHDRVRRVREQGEPPEDFDLDIGVDGDGETGAADGEDSTGDDDDADPATGPDLPEPVREEFDEIRKKLQYGLDQEFGVEMETQAHYWPLVVHLGVERLKGMWLEEVKRTMETTDGIDAPDED